AKPSPKRVEYRAKIVITKHSKSDQSNQRQSNAKPACGSSATDSNFSVDQREECRHDQAGKQQSINNRIDNENDVPRIPSFRKRPERTHAIAVRKIQQDVRQAGDKRE